MWWCYLLSMLPPSEAPQRHVSYIASVAGEVGAAKTGPQ